jgi:hypothetical protein
MSSVPISSSRFDVQIDDQTAESWPAILSQFSDANIYQTWAYGSVRWGEKQLSHLLLRKAGKIFAAAQIRIVRLPLLPAGVAYLRWGPLCHRKGEELDSITVVAMVASLQAEYSQRRGLTLQIIPNACVGDSRGDFFAAALSQADLRPDATTDPYRTVRVALSPAVELLRKRLDQKWRNQLNRSEKNGLGLQIKNSVEAYREFARLYEDMWARKQFKSSVDPAEFGRIQAALSAGQEMQTFIAYKDGAAVAALVVSLHGDTGIYLLGATNEQGRELKAAYFLQWQAMLWLKEHGAIGYDLGGIDAQANPGGYHFKSGFGGAEVTQLTLHHCDGSFLSRGVAGIAAWRRRTRTAIQTAAPVTGMA